MYLVANLASSGAKKLKVAFHQFRPIGLLEEWSKCKIQAHLILSLLC